MSKYTTQVRFICESKASLYIDVSTATIDEIVEKSWKVIFENFPIFDENYRSVLCKKILRHYYTREICAESVGLWLFWINTKMQEIMPLYNQFYESTLLQFNPLYDVDKTLTRKGSNNTSTNQSNNSYTVGSNANSGSTISKYSDTPQGGIVGLEQGNYMTNATINNSNNTSNYNDNSNTVLTGNVNSLDEYVEVVSGKQGTENYSDMLNKFRSTFLNVDELIIEELQPLFMTLW